MTLELRFAGAVALAQRQPLDAAWTAGAVAGIQRWLFFVHVIHACAKRGERQYHRAAACARCNAGAVRAGA